MSYAPRIRKYWTENEDRILRHEAEIQLSEGALKDWNRIAAKLAGRTNKDCRKRWSKVGGNVNKGPWTVEEDGRLREAVSKHGYCWTVVAGIVETRHADQCAKRWHYFLDPNLSHKEWDNEEDDRLIAAVQLRGRSWTLISQEEFPYRSATDVKNRYVVIERKRQQHELVISGISGADHRHLNDSAGDDLPSISEALENNISDSENTHMEDIGISLGSSPYDSRSEAHVAAALYQDHGSGTEQLLPMPSSFADLSPADPYSTIMANDSHEEGALAWDDNFMDKKLFLSGHWSGFEDFSDLSGVYSEASLMLDSSGSSKNPQTPDVDPAHRNKLILEDIQPDVLSRIMDVLFQSRASVKMSFVNGDSD